MSKDQLMDEAYSYGWAFGNNEKALCNECAEADDDVAALKAKLERAKQLWIQLTNCDYVSDNGQVVGVCATTEIMQGFDDLFETNQLGYGVCEKHCILCSGMDHHWIEGFAEDDNGNIINPDEPIWICKHCEITKPFL